jgi:hypothetical protein
MPCNSFLVTLKSISEEILNNVLGILPEKWFLPRSKNMRFRLTQALRYCTLKLVPGQIYFLQGREVAKGFWNYSIEVVFFSVL